MNPIERMRDEILGRVPGVAAEIDAPADESGTWVLDVRSGDGASWVVVEWGADRGFGVSTPGPDDYGLKPDELYPNARAALGRVIDLIETKGRTSPPMVVQLAELRALRGFTQPELAGRAGMKQANLSRIENRDDVKLSTLSKIVAAMGGAAAIQVTFPDGSSYRVSIGRDVKQTGICPLDPRSLAADGTNSMLLLVPKPTVRKVPRKAARRPTGRKASDN